MTQNKGNSETCDKLLQERIGQALRNQQDQEKLDIRTLEAWAEAKRVKDRNRRRRYALIACCLILVCIGAAALHLNLLPGSGISMAKKGGDSISETPGGAVIKDNQTDADENLGAVRITIDDWAQVAAAQKEHPDMLVPGYVPEGYEFEKLVIEGNALTEKYRFLFVRGEEELEINIFSQNEEMAVFNYDISVDLRGSNILINTDEKTAHYEINDRVITIWGISEESEIINLLKQLKGVN